jgi:hypothetical protein
MLVTMEKNKTLISAKSMRSQQAMVKCTIGHHSDEIIA